MAESLAEGIVLRVAPSADLRSEFDRLAYATTHAGELKFSSRIRRKLATIITCRSYGPQVLQLCHLIIAAGRITGSKSRSDFIAFIMELSDCGPVAYSSFFHDRLVQSEIGVALGVRLLELDYGENHFQVHFRQLPLLLALFEFCVNRLGLELFTEISEADMRSAEKTVSTKTISSLANRLSSDLYEALKTELPTVQNLRKSRHLIDFLNRRDNQFSADSLGDETVLDFWISAASEENAFGTDFKQFSTVFGAFVSLHKTLSQGRALLAQDRAASIGEDWQHGEINPADIDEGPWSTLGDPEIENDVFETTLMETIETIDGDSNPLEMLSAPPCDRIKFLNHVERRATALLFECGVSLSSFPISYLRVECFATSQRSIARAKPARARELIETGATHTYADQIATLKKLSAHVTKVGLATLHVVGMAEKHGQRENSGKPITLDAKRAEVAFRELNRTGFDSSAWDEPGQSDAFRISIEPLSRIAYGLNQFRSQLESFEPWEERWRQDLIMFSNEFERLYCDPDRTTDENESIVNQTEPREGEPL